MKPKQENTCKLCEIQLWLHQCRKIIRQLSNPDIGTTVQRSWVNLALSSLEMAYDQYDHDCEFHVSDNTLRDKT